VDLTAATRAAPRRRAVAKECGRARRCQGAERAGVGRRPTLRRPEQSGAAGPKRRRAVGPLRRGHPRPSSEVTFSARSSGEEAEHAPNLRESHGGPALSQRPVWHGRHRVAHITTLRRRMGWN